MMNNFIAKEGLKSIYISFALTLFSYLFICDTLALLLLLVSLLLMYIYRANLVNKASTDNLVSVTDGKVFAIDKTEERTSIYIEVGLLDSHILLAPKDGSFKRVCHKNGLNLSQFSYKAKELNSKTTLAFDDIEVTLYEGRWNISHEFINDGEVKQYEKIGLLINGIVKISIPSSLSLNVKLGQKIKAGETL